MHGSVHCGAHGERAPAFVCRHLVRGSNLGFVEPAGDHEPGAVDALTAWCDACEAVRTQQGGWNDESEAFAQVTLICSGCFEVSRGRNAIGGPGWVRRLKADLS
jgi:hypothetical protein